MSLTIQDLGALGELLGSVAVLATLVYLALQTRQNTIAIGAQLDAARSVAQQEVLLTAATSNELLEALKEDRSDEVPTNQLRRGQYWLGTMLFNQWALTQARRCLLPTLHETGMESLVSGLFSRYRSFERWWDGNRARFHPEFVEFVEEQRSKAA